MFNGKNAPSIPMASPSYGKGPFTFYNREYFIIAFKTTECAISNALPEPIEPIGDNIVLFEFMKMPDSPGFGSYNESGIVIPGKLHGKEVNFTSQMYLDCEPPIYGGREIWGFPKKRGKPTLECVEDTLTGKLCFNNELIALGTMPYKPEPIMARHERSDEKIKELKAKLTKPQINLKVLPNVDGTDCVRELIEYSAEVIDVKEAWKGPARLHLVPHVNAPVADFPVLEVIGATHMMADIILPYGKVVHTY